MKNWILLLKREFSQFRSNTVIIAIFIGAPLLYGLLLGAVYKKGKVSHLPVLVIDLDDTPLSHRLLDMVDDSEVIDAVLVQNQNDLRAQIIHEEYSAIITIPERFEAETIQKRHPEIGIDINTSNILTANYAAKAIQQIVGTLNAGIEIEALKKTGVPAITAQTQYEAFGVSYTRFFNPSANYMTFLWPGVLAIIVQQVFLLALALSFAREFEEKTFFTEFMPKAKNVWNALLLKALPFWIIGVGILLSLRFMFPLFEVSFHVNILAIVVLVSLLVLSATFLGILASIAIPSQLKATEILMVVATPSFIISGFTWPLSQMPSYMVALAKSIPSTHFLIGFRKIMMYDANLSDVWPEVKGLLILTIVFALLSYFLLKYKIYVHTKKVAISE